MSPATTTNDSTNTLYKNNSRDNFMEWKRDLDATLDKHPDRLTTVVDDDKLHVSIVLKYKREYKSIEEVFTDTVMTEIITAAKKSAYLLLVKTIADKGTLKTITRKYTNDPKGAVDYITKHWDASAHDDRQGNLDTKRTEFITAGAAGPNLSAMTDFVEGLMQFNTELEGSDFEMKDPTIVTHVLTALQKYNKPLVTAYKAGKKSTKK